MKHLIFLSLLFLAACSVNEPEPDVYVKGFTANSVPGVWQGEALFRIQLEGASMSIDRDGGTLFRPKSGTIKIDGGIMTLEMHDPFGISASDVLFYRGQISGDTITGEYWTDYFTKKIPLIFYRIR